MTKNCRSILILLALGCSLTVTAQEKESPVRFANGNFITGNNISKQSFQKEDLRPSLFDGKYFVLVQFSSLPSQAVKEQLKNAGLELNEYIPANAWLATIKNSFDFHAAKNFNIISINNIPAFFKIDPALFNFEKRNSKQDQVAFAVSFFASANKTAVEQALQQLGVVLVPSKFNFTNTILIQADVSKLHAIAELPFVSFVRQQFLKDKPINYNSVAIHGISSLQSISGKNLNGKNMIVGVGDNADISTHVDFTGKIISRHPFPWDYHGTHTSGTTVGAGFLDPRNHGVAPKAHVVSQWFSDVIVNTPTYFLDYNMVSTNNSYYMADNGCTGSRVYDVLSNYIDNQMRNYDEVLHVIASGNDGDLTCAGYPASFGTVKSGWQCAKNVITVGAIDQENYGIASFSSRGPMIDGRIKPEIVTSGYGTNSCYPFNTYALNWGTSMASPVIAGVTALMQESYRKSHSGANAKAALIKSLMCNTAEDLGNDGPDYTFGFGMLNARKAVEAMEANQYFTGSISTAQDHPYSVVVPAGVRRLKVLLNWADYPATANASLTLVNDLDLTVTQPLPLIIHQPLILNPAIENDPAQENQDHLNNIEQVVIDAPAAGTYNINVNGFAIPQGPQTYFLTYQMDMIGITVEYPFGGETFVPGQIENLRWTAYGNEANTFTIEYSSNNGANWTLINNNVDSTARSYNWTVPATAGNNYLIRVSRNNTALTDQSDLNFTVLGQPAATATVPCEGYVQLNWAAITGATSYDILQLKGDSMDVIGNTAGNTFLVSGLNSTTEYWFSVRGKNGSVNGLRSMGVNATPATGACSLANFNGNFKAVSIDAPVTGRQFTSSALTASQQVKLTIKNLDNITSSGSYSLSYQVNGGSVVTEVDNINIVSLGSRTHTFSATAAFASPGIYNIKAWVTKTGDGFQTDDTVRITIKNLANPLLALPVADGFESTTIKDYTTNTIGLDGDDRTDFKTGSTRGRARTFVNTGFALNGNRALTLDQAPYGSLVTDSLLMTWNLNNYNSGQQLRIDFNYKNHGQAANPNNKVWIRGSDTSPWIFAYDLIENQNGLGQWKLGLINVNEVLDTVVPAQTIGTSFQIKIAQQGNTSANVANPLLDQDDGYTIDEVAIAEAVGDVGISEVISPSKTGCGLTNNNQVSIKIKNYTNTTINNVDVNYRFNNGTVVSETIASLSPNQLLTHTFAVPANLAAFIDYNFEFWLTAPGDNYQSNDSILEYSVHNSPVISSYPYLEGFESNNGNWYTKGTNTSWEWGTPLKTIIDKAANGNKAWFTSLSDNYNDNEISYLYSPCFDLTGLAQPVLSFSHIFDIEQDFDYTWVEYSTDGKVWRKLGTAGSGTNWYDNVDANNWEESDTIWHVASIDIPPYAGTMRFRFVMSSDGGVNYEGVGIDDIRVHQKQHVTVYLPVLSGSQTTGATNNWLPFTEMVTGGIFAEVNTNGQDLGMLGIDVYQNTNGIVRNSNGQYYLDRSFVIHSDNPPAGPVGVRVYFTDGEANALINATGCTACVKPHDAYELGVTQYTGDYFIDENGNVNDNLTGVFGFIDPANTLIIPHGNGYYAEFSVNNFSEFYLSKASIKPAASNVCPGSTVILTAATTGATYQWQEDSGSGFVNIVNGPNYAGTTTNTLQLIGLPTSKTGSKYRCVVNGVNGPETLLRFTAIWNGNTNTDWQTAGNWNCNVVPDQYTDVLIPGGLTNNPVLNGNTAVRSVRVYPGVPVLIKSGNVLDIKGP